MKSPFLSKTQWFNAVLLFLATLEQTAPILKPYLGEGSTSVLLFVATFGNMYLRQITTQPVQSVADVVKSSLK